MQTDELHTQSTNGNGYAQEPERELYVILSDKNAINALAFSWVALLVVLVVTWVRLRRLQAEIA